MDKLRVATVGTGYFSHFQYAAWARIPEVNLVGICNRSIKPAKELAEQYNIAGVYTDFAQMLDEIKPDLVDVITPPATHVKYVMHSVERNIPVICQKPFTPSVQEARELTCFIEEKNAKVIIHENFRFQPWYQKIKSLLQDGVLGQLYEISFALRPGDGRGPDAYVNRQPYFPQMERFLIHETAVHLIDVFRYLFGDVKSLMANLRRVNPAIKGEDAGIILFEFSNGASGLFDGNRLSDHKAKNRRLTMGELRIEGERGTLYLNGDGALSFRNFGENQEVEISYDWEDRGFGGDCVYNLQRHVTNHFILGTELMNTAKEYLNNVEIAEAVYNSNDQGIRVDFI